MTDHPTPSVIPAENLYKPGTPEWRNEERAMIHMERFERERTGRMQRDTLEMKRRASLHYEAVQEAESAGRRPLKPEWIEAMRDVEEQYPTAPKPDVWAAASHRVFLNAPPCSYPRGGVHFIHPDPPPSVVIIDDPVKQCSLSGTFNVTDAIAWYARFRESEPEPERVRTIKGRPAGRVRSCHHGDERGRCRQCSGVGRRR